jgi:hypothetical protein
MHLPIRENRGRQEPHQKKRLEQSLNPERRVSITEMDIIE